MKKISLLFAVAILLTIPAVALAHCGSCDMKPAGDQKMAAKHEGHGDAGMQKGMEGHDHSGMAAKGNMAELGTMSAKGIKGAASMKDVSASMAKMGMKTTHHLMVSFTDEKTGKPVESGTVAVKINDPDGVATGPMEMMGMSGHFGADVVLDKKGEYHFILGTKLADGETRQYHYHTVIK